MVQKIFRNDYRLIQFVLAEYNQSGKDKILHPGDEVTYFDEITKEKIVVGYVDMVADNVKFGQTTYTVLPVRIEESLPESEKKQIREKQKVVYVLSKGSTAPELSIDSIVDWSTNLQITGQIMLKKLGLSRMKYFTKQGLATAISVNQYLDIYPNAGFVFGGHSQGSMNLQFAMSVISDPSRVIAVFLSEGPNMWEMLTEDQQLQVSSMKNVIFNIIDRKDIVPYGYDNPEQMVGQLLDLMTVSTDLVNQHMTKGYIYDSRNNLILKDFNSAVKYRINLTKVYLKLVGIELSRLHENYRGSNKELYIEYTTVAAILSTLEITVYNEIVAYKENVQLAIKLLEETWESYLSAVKELSPNLSHDERLDVLAAQGVTENTLVTIPILEIKNMNISVDHIYQEFQTLMKQVKDGVREVQKLDFQTSEMFLDY
jgi:hypothetical protein